MIEFRILGPLEARANGEALPLGGPKQRALLAFLLLNANSTVSRDRLIDELWGERAAASSHALDVQLSRLRKVLGPDGSSGAALATESHGYVLRVEPDLLDLERFQRLLREGRRALEDGDDELAADTLRSAEALWRGRALADLEFEPFARVEIERLEELRLSAIEDRIEAELALGRHRSLIGELETLVAEHPLRERLRHQHMLALYRCGRQAAALDSYRVGRALLVEQLGLEPGPQLKELEQSILRQDPGLDLAARAVSAAVATVTEASPTEAVVATPVARPRRFGARALVAGLVLIAAVAGGLVAIFSGGGGHRVPSQPAKPLPPGVTLLDIATGKPLASIPQLGVPLNARFASGSFWTIDQSARTIARVDPRTGRVIGRIGSPVNISGTESVAVDGNEIWAADWSGPNVYELDARTGFPVLHVRLSHRRFDTRRTVMLGVGHGSVWVGIWRTGELIRLDERTGRILSRRFGFVGVDGGAPDGGALWVSTPDALTRIDVQTGAITAVARIPGPHQYIAIGGGYAWTANIYRGEVYKVDTQGHVAATYRTGAGAWRLSYSEGKLWVSNAVALTITSIDAASGRQRTYRIGRIVLAAAAAPGRLLVLTLPLRGIAIVPTLKHAGVRLTVPGFIGVAADPAMAASDTSLGFDPFVLQIEHATEAGLLNYPDAPPPAGLRLRPELAAAMPSLSADGRTYTFRIRRGYRFAPPSGAPVTAETVRASIERALSPTFGIDAPGFGYLSDVVGARAFHAGRAPHVRGLSARGSLLRITLTKPSADFLERISLPFFSPVPFGTPTAPNGNASVAGDLAPPSAGPYFMAGNLTAAFIILRRNPYYAGPRPHRLATIAFAQDTVAENAVQGMLRGESDGVELPDPDLAPGGAIARRYRARPAGGGFTSDASELEQTRYIALNAQNGVFTDGRLRRAAAHALSRNALATGWGIATGGDPNTGRLVASGELLPPNVRDYRPSRPYSLDQTLAHAGGSVHASGVARMAVPVGCAQCESSFQSVQAALAPLGVDVRAKSVPTLATVVRHPQRFDLYDGVSRLPYPDPASFLTRMLGDDVPRAWLPAATRASIARLAQMRGSKRDAAAVSLARTLETRDVPVLAYGHPVIGQLYSSRIGCRVTPGFGFGLDLAALCLR